MSGTSDERRPFRLALWLATVGFLGAGDLLVLSVALLGSAAPARDLFPGSLLPGAPLLAVLGWKAAVLAGLVLVARLDRPLRTMALGASTALGAALAGWNAYRLVDGASLAAVQLGAVRTLALLYGGIWAVVNAYVFYPVVRTAVASRTGSGPATRPTGGGGSGSLPPEDRPVVDVLIPAYDEGGTVSQAIGSVRASDYPDRLLNVTVLVEPDDEATRGALADLDGAYEFTEVVVPAGYPGAQTKPRALNYGFAVTGGDVVGVVDAEDVVDEGLFDAVARALLVEGYDYVQGVLDMVNEGDGWTNTLFRGEYGFWFRIVLPAFRACEYPVPLGGSTNFFRREVLDAVGTVRHDRYPRPVLVETREWALDRDLPDVTPWDPANVTEDFELGLLLWQEGYSLGYIGAVTREESPLDLENWITQRTRWQKGKLYTLGQYARHPPERLRAKWHCYLQSSLPHLGAVNLSGVVILFLYANAMGIRIRSVPGGLLVVGLVFVVVLMAMQGYSYRLASDTRPLTGAVRTALSAVTLAGYWLLQWGADLRAMAQTYRGRFHWETTDHGHRTAASILTSLLADDRELDPAATRDVLFNARRRRVAEYLGTTDGPVSLHDLTADLAKREEAGTPTARKDIYLSLHHAHLRKLDALGVIDYDPDAREVRTPTAPEA